ERPPRPQRAGRPARRQRQSDPGPENQGSHPRGRPQARGPRRSRPQGRQDRPSRQEEGPCRCPAGSGPRQAAILRTPAPETIVMSRPDFYPRARPHRPPPETEVAPVPMPPPPPAPAPLRSQLVLVAGVCSLCLALGLVFGVLVLGRPAPPREGTQNRKTD